MPRPIHQREKRVCSICKQLTILKLRSSYCLKCDKEKKMVTIKSAPTRLGRPPVLGKRRICVCGATKDPYGKYCKSCYTFHRARSGKYQGKDHEEYIKKEDFENINGDALYC